MITTHDIQHGNVDILEFVSPLFFLSCSLTVGNGHMKDIDPIIVWLHLKTIIFVKEAVRFITLVGL